MATFDITKHFLVPVHIILDKNQEDEFLKKNNLAKDDLPKINFDDPAISLLKPKIGDVILINRKSPNFDALSYYRVVV